ncbi:VOC family protein [Halobacillus mangrovi]|uniref:VOC family protein n=1 Tax=Halobacillus mangrovi TaxID=402384 RepID=UPI003D9624B4
MKTSLRHVRANVKDINKAVQWYEDTLGFVVEVEWPPDNPNYVHFEYEDGAMFGLLEHEQIPSRGRFNFYVDDVEDVWSRVKDKVEVIEALFNTEYGSRKFTILDLDGNELSFVQD